jgi:O-acetyl-ADP-ribose deacetylase (regulator of RNase III)
MAFPAISCGVYGYPVPDAARIAVREARTALAGPDTLNQVLFACFTDQVFAEYKRVLELPRR